MSVDDLFELGGPNDAYVWKFLYEESHDKNHEEEDEEDEEWFPPVEKFLHTPHGVVKLKKISIGTRNKYVRCEKCGKAIGKVANYAWKTTTKYFCAECVNKYMDSRRHRNGTGNTI